MSPEKQALMIQMRFPHIRGGLRLTLVTIAAIPEITVPRLSEILHVSQPTITRHVAWWANKSAVQVQPDGEVRFLGFNSFDSYLRKGGMR